MAQISSPGSISHIIPSASTPSTISLDPPDSLSTRTGESSTPSTTAVLNALTGCSFSEKNTTPSSLGEPPVPKNIDEAQSLFLAGPLLNLLK